MTEIELKQQEELSEVSPLLSDLGIKEGQYRCDDRPDIIAKYDGKVIGIEIVRYEKGLNAKKNKALQDVLDEYAREFDKKNEKRYAISVDFLFAEIPSGVKFKNVRLQLFREIDNCLYDVEAAKRNQFISDVFIVDIPNGKQSFVSFTDIFEYEDTNIEMLLDLISNKENLLEGYKKLPKNKDISEWWLLVFYPVREHVDYRNLVIPNDFTSTYDRIYLSELYCYKEIFRK